MQTRHAKPRSRADLAGCSHWPQHPLWRQRQRAVSKTNRKMHIVPEDDAPTARGHSPARERMKGVVDRLFTRQNPGRHVAVSPGVGKTHLAIALGRAAIGEGYSVLFVTAPVLVAGLAKAHADGRLEERLGFFAQAQAPHCRRTRLPALRAQCRHLFFQLVSRRYEHGGIDDHLEPLGRRMGQRLRRSRRRHRHSRSDL